MHVDFCQKGKDYFLVLIDSHSKWIDVKHMTSTTTERTIDELRLIFAEHGLPEQLTEWNQAHFSSTIPSCLEWCSREVGPRGEAGVTGNGGMTIKHRLANFLIKYRSTPHSVTGRTPAELMVKRQLRTRLTLLKPNLAQAVENKQMKQKLYHDKS